MRNCYIRFTYLLTREFLDFRMYRRTGVNTLLCILAGQLQSVHGSRVRRWRRDVFTPSQRRKLQASTHGNRSYYLESFDNKYVSK